MAATRLRIFVSSVQKEFAKVRQDLKAFLLGDAVLRRFVSDVFLFEDLPAVDRRADELYLDRLADSDIYLGILGNEYGSEDAQGISPTEHEYDRASKLGKTRLIYVWGASDKPRSPKMRRLVKRASAELVRRRIEDSSGLTAEVYASLVEHLDSLGALRVPPFDSSTGRAKVGDLSRKRVEWFLDRARAKRGFPLDRKTGTEALLTHLNLASEGKPINAAVVLFGANPQRFHTTAQVKCVHCHGTEYQRPFASLQVYGGDLFEQVDQAVDFVLGKVNHLVGTRAAGPQAPQQYELPPDAVSEAVVNAVAHRDYNSNASVEVRLFADRLEVWNPGALPGTLTLEDLRGDHASIPFNPLIAESLYLAGYIERVGSGTQAMIRLCLEAGLSEPSYEVRQGFFVLTLWRDWLTTSVVSELDLNDRQRQVIAVAKSGEPIGNSLYQERFGVSKPTASRDLEDLVSKGVFEKIGTTGKGTHYKVRKGLTKGSKGSRTRKGLTKDSNGS